MAYSTIVMAKHDGQIQLAALGGGAYNTSTGALIGAADSLTIDFEDGNLTLDPPKRSIVQVLNRGRAGSVPQIRYGNDEAGSFSFTAQLRDLSDTSEETLADIAMWCAGRDAGSDYVGTNWESTLASAAAAGDHEVNLCGFKWTMTNAGDNTDTHGFAANYCYLTISFGEGDTNTISISGTIYDQVEDLWFA